MSKPAECKGCHRFISIQAWGLCKRCYGQTDIRHKHGAKCTRELTTEEVEAMVAANWDTMPSGPEDAADIFDWKRFRSRHSS